MTVHCHEDRFLRQQALHCRMVEEISMVAPYSTDYFIIEGCRACWELEDVGIVKVNCDDRRCRLFPLV